MPLLPVGAVVGGRREKPGAGAQAIPHFSSWTFVTVPPPGNDCRIALRRRWCPPLSRTAFGTDWQPHEHAKEDTNVYRMDVRNRSDWEIVTRFPSTPRWMGGMAVCNGKLYVIGGRDIPLAGLTVDSRGKQKLWHFAKVVHPTPPRKYQGRPRMRQLFLSEHVRTTSHLRNGPIKYKGLQEVDCVPIVKRTSLSI